MSEEFCDYENLERYKPWVDFDELLDLQVKRLDHDRKELLSVWCEWSSFFFGLDPTASMAHTNIVCAHLSHT